MRAELTEQTGRAEGVAAQIAGHRERIAEIDKRRAELEEAAESARNVAEGRKMRIDNRERELAGLTDELTQRIVELGNADSRISLLEEMEREYEGFGGAVKAVMRSASAASCAASTGRSQSCCAPATRRPSP